MKKNGITLIDIAIVIIIIILAALLAPPLRQAYLEAKRDAARQTISESKTDLSQK